jgi:cation diffusion facilitator family transporter
MTDATAPVTEMPGLTKYAWLSIAAAVVTIALKTGAYLLTGSVGLLSDAAESVVNLVAAVIALVALTVAARPADHNHHYGHGKAEYFSAGIEGLMIFVAAALIIVSAVQRLIHPQELEKLGIGLAITLLATAVNGAVGLLLVRVGRTHRSATLVADGKHLMTDVWTSVGVVVGVGLVAVTGWLPLDSLVAIAVAINILWMGWRLVASSTTSLLDAALSPADVALVTAVLDRHRTEDVDFHGLQTRESGRQRFVSVHVLVPGAWTVQQGHDVAEVVETDIRGALEHAHVSTHVEPREDHRSYEDYAYDGIVRPEDPDRR